MATEVVMPALGMAQETGKLVRWLKGEGEEVVKGEPLMEVETDKATVEVESPASGTLVGLTAAGGADIAVGEAIALILAPGEPFTSPPRGGPALARGEVGPAREARPAGWGESSQQIRPATRISASPKARRLAEEKGIDLARLTGSGPGGAVIEEDILGMGPAPAGAATESALWRAMAENVTRSWREAPHFFVIREVDAGRLVEARTRHGHDVTYTDLLLKATAQALAGHPRLNNGHAEVNIGLAVALPDGLIVPVIYAVDRLALADIAARRREVVERVKAGRVRSSDLTGGTFTITNLGMYGVDLFTAIVTDGQAAILAVGRIVDRVVARDGVPEVRPSLSMSLSCDHRRVDGVRAAEFMQTLANLLETLD